MRFNVTGLCMAMLFSPTLMAQSNDGRLLATGAVGQIEGTAGGGIVPMAVLSGYGTRDESGGAAFYSAARTDDFGLTVLGASWTWQNRVEFSVARQELDITPISNALGVGKPWLKQNILGMKIRVAGDVIYSDMPQIALGIQYKHHQDFFIPQAAGARKDSGTDLYLAATKVWLGGLWGYNVLLNGVVRATKANQGGLLGFGADKRDSYQAQYEVSAGVFLHSHWLVGGEFRAKPDNLSFAREDHWRDVFVAWFPDKQWSITAAWVDLGSIAGLGDQQGWYVSVQGSY